jgi:hypothetical protein
MLSFLERLQRKPVAVRKRVALVGAGAVTLVIVLLWLASLAVGESGPQRAVAKEKGPIEAIGESIGAFVTDISRVVDTMKASVGGTFEFYNASTTPIPEGDKGLSP